MPYYVIKNTKTGRYVQHTDYRYNPPHQKTVEDPLLSQIYADKEAAEIAFKVRKCGKAYKIVPLRAIMYEIVVP